MLRVGTAALAVVVTLAAVSDAQVATDGFGIERFRIAMDREGMLDVDWADVPGHLSWSAGVFAGLAHDPLVIYDQRLAPLDVLVERRLTTGLVGSLALWDRLELGASLDLVGYQRGSSESPTMRTLPTAGVGDVRIAAKVLLLDQRRLQISLLPAVTAPGGSARGYLREAGVTFAPGLAVAARRGRVRAAANLGYLMRPRVDTAGLVSDEEAFVRTALGVRLGAARDPLAELWWSTSIAAPLVDAANNQIAVEMLAGGTTRIGAALGLFVAGGVGLDNGFGTPGWRALLGVRFESSRGDHDGDRLEGAADRCPDEPEDFDRWRDDDGCPDPDNDGDGLADAVDRCPVVTEDRDGYMDGDGCPDPDNDGDDLADAQDRCPTSAEDKDGYQDDDGCPDPSARLAGRVVDLDGRPIPHASVAIEVAPSGARIDATAGDDGAFAIEVEGSFVRVVASSGEYQQGVAETAIVAGSAKEVEIKLARKVREAQLRGQVLSFAGKPVAATITIESKATATATATATAGEDGYYIVELPAGTFVVTIEAPGYVTQRRNVTVRRDGVTILNVDLRGAK